jgi:hypothetical protein
MSKRQARIGGGILAGGLVLFLVVEEGAGGWLGEGEDVFVRVGWMRRGRDLSHNHSKRTSLTLSGGMMVLVLVGYDSGDRGDKRPCRVRSI